VLLPVLAIVSTALLAILRATDRLPAVGARTFAGMLLTLVLVSAAGLALGLAASAAVGDAGQATLALPMLCFPQVLFAGAVVPLGQMAPAGQLMSVPLATRWAFESLGRTLPDDPAAADGYPEVFTGSPVTGWLVLAVGTILLLLATARLLRR
jgi:hypothetical protein